MGLFFAWAIGEGIIVWRWAKQKAPPPPGELLLASGLFLGLAILAEYRPARGVATAFAFAVDLAVLLQVVGKAPSTVTGWPPQLVTDPSVLLPGGGSSTGTGSAAAGGGGTNPIGGIPNPVSGGSLNPFQQIIGEPL